MSGVLLGGFSSTSPNVECSPFVVLFQLQKPVSNVAGYVWEALEEGALLQGWLLCVSLCALQIFPALVHRSGQLSKKRKAGSTV